MSMGGKPERTAVPRLRVLVMLSALLSFGGVATDLYLPAMPTMARSLGAAPGDMELTVTGYLIGLTFGQLFWGPIGDRFGRRRPIAAGLLLFAIGSAGCALTGSASGMIGWRVVQAFGACAGVTLARAMVRDLYEGDAAARVMSTLMTVMAITPLLGPIVGVQVLAIAGWRSVFWLLLAFAAATLTMVATVQETLPHDRRSVEAPMRLLASYGVLLRDRRTLAYAGVSAFFYAGMFAYIAGTPFALIGFHHVSPPTYALLFALGIVGIMIANTVNARFVRAVGSDRILRTGAIGAAGAGVAAALAAITGAGGLPGLLVPLWLFMACSGFIIANAVTGALSLHPLRSGAASAVVGTLQYGAGMVGSSLVAALSDGTPAPMGLVIGGAGLCSAICAMGLQARPRARAARPDHDLDADISAVLPLVEPAGRRGH